MLALKRQFGGKAYIVLQSKDANSIVQTAQFNGPTRQYTYDQHVARFNGAYNELALIGEPIQEHIKVQLFCNSLQEEMISQPKMKVQLAPATARNFTKATGLLKSMKNILVSNKAKAGVDRYIAELGITQKQKGGGGRGGGHPRNKRKKAPPEAVSNFTATATRNGPISPRSLCCREGCKESRGHDFVSQAGRHGKGS
jgi:hypothetical protein